MCVTSGYLAMTLDLGEVDVPHCCTPGTGFHFLCAIDGKCACIKKMLQLVHSIRPVVNSKPATPILKGGVANLIEPILGLLHCRRTKKKALVLYLWLTHAMVWSRLTAAGKSA